MNARLKSLTVPVLLSGAWGVITFLLGYTLLNNLPLGHVFFYPALLTGVAAVSAIYSGSGKSLTRAALTGFVSGFIYLLISPMFPLLAGILAGASLGGGLSDSGGRSGGLLSAIISTLKGVIIFPLAILSGKFLGLLLLIYLNSAFLCWVFWGAWLGLGVCLIHTPIFKRTLVGCDARLITGLDEFRSEAGEIHRDLAELRSGID